MRAFAGLIRHFFGRFFDKESLSPQGEMETNVIQVLALLAVPGLFGSMFLLARAGLSGWPLVVERYFHVAYSMVVMGFVVVFEWDSLFPDRRDYLILTPLPLRPMALLAAKLAALAMFLSLFAVDVNVLGTLLLPAITGRPDLAAGIAAHAVSTLTGAFFMALATAGVQGILIVTLSAKAFRRVSAVFQALLMGALVMALFLGFPLAQALPRLVQENHPALYFIPVVWFVGVYEMISPALTTPTVLIGFGLIAAEATVIAASVVALTYIAGFRRHARRAVESIDLKTGGPGRLRLSLSRLLDRVLLATPVERAAFHFISETIARSLKHRLFLAAYAGFGAALAALSLRAGKPGLLPLALTLSFFLVSGLRAAFNFPSELNANWAFQITEHGSLMDYLSATRKWIVACGIVPLFVLIAPVEFVFFPWWAALFHLAYGITLSLLLMQVMFFGFYKVPFTCSYFPGKANLIGLFVLYLYGFTAYSYSMCSFGIFLLQRPFVAALFFGAAVLAYRALGRWREREAVIIRTLDYEDAPDPVVRTLGLTSS